MYEIKSIKDGTYGAYEYSTPVPADYSFKQMLAMARDIANANGYEASIYDDENEWALTGSVDDMIAKVDGLRGNVTKDCLDEGIVWHLHEDQQLSEGLADELGANRCFKIINNKYLTKNGL